MEMEFSLLSPPGTWFTFVFRVSRHYFYLIGCCFCYFRRHCCCHKQRRCQATCSVYIESSQRDTHIHTLHHQSLSEWKPLSLLEEGSVCWWYGGSFLCKRQQPSRINTSLILINLISPRRVAGMCLSPKRHRLVHWSPKYWLCKPCRLNMSTLRTLENKTLFGNNFHVAFYPVCVLSVTNRYKKTAAEWDFWKNIQDCNSHQIIVLKRYLSQSQQDAMPEHKSQTASARGPFLFLWTVVAGF